MCILDSSKGTAARVVESMERARERCAEAQEAYAQCTKRWFFDKLLAGQWVANEECLGDFERLRDCIALHFQQVCNARTPMPAALLRRCSHVPRCPRVAGSDRVL